MSLPVFSDIYFRSSKAESILIPTGTVFYNCNKRDSAGAELKKHAALSNARGSELFQLSLCQGES